MMPGVYGGNCIERHSVLIFDRGGKRRISQPVDLAEIQWERAMDRKTQASLLITGQACREQSRILEQIEPRRHELAIFRGRERVWEGPITQTKSTSSYFKLDASDIIEYLDHTALSKKWPNADGGGPPLMTARLKQIIEYELSTNYTVATGAGNRLITRWENIGKPANIKPYLDIRAGTTLTRAVTEAFEMTVGEHLYNLGRSVGVNYTTVGRSLVIWDGSIGRTRTVTEKDFSGDFEVISAGSEFFNVAHVIATETDATTPPSVGHATNDMSFYGPWETTISTSSEDPSSSATPQELNTQARRAISGLYPVPLQLIAAQGASLILSPGLTMSELVAGVELPVRAKQNIRPVSQLQRLDEMTVRETAQGETITVNLTALGEVEV